MKRILLGSLLIASLFTVTTPVTAQEVFPRDNGIYTYHTAPRYRESESHPLRIVGYILHPIGWVLREGIFRPLSYFASSSPTRKSVMGYREPFDYRGGECFDPDAPVPNCREISPFNSMYGDDSHGRLVEPEAPLLDEQKLFFSDVNFDFDKRSLNATGKQQAQEVYRVLSQTDAGVKIYLEGHTDSVGSDQYNYRLGMDRAVAVQNELISLGLSPERLSTVSFGETKPIASNSTAEGRAKNRRVETRVE